MANLAPPHTLRTDTIHLKPRWLFLLTVFCALLLWLKGKNKRNPSNLPLPPGPKRVPIFGNLFQLSREAYSGTWRMYARWAKEYESDLVYVEAMGQPILVLNSYKAAHELLERRAPNYSDRWVPPALAMIKMDWAFTIMDYGPLWRAHRRAFQQHYNSNAIHKFHPIIKDQTHSFLQRLAANPKKFLDDTKYLFGTIIIQVSYGPGDSTANAEFVDHAQAIVAGFGATTEPGSYLVDTFPVLRYIPNWFPGAGWKRQLKAVADINIAAKRKHFGDALKRAQAGIQSEYSNVATCLIEKLPPVGDPDYALQEEIACNTTLVAYVAGSDTTVSSANALYIALASNPEVQRRAQQELETVLGPCRLPDPSDIPQLNYIRAIVKEVSRWHNALPMAIPHVCSADDEYNGYFIPKGTIVLGNSWAIMHSEGYFDDPMAFKPERYLTKDGKLNANVLDPNAAAFGFGRRICPGRHLSTEALTFMAASLLSVFSVVLKKDAAGNSIPVKLETTLGFIIKPLPFEVDIQLRSKEHANLLLEL